MGLGADPQWAWGRSRWAWGEISIGLGRGPDGPWDRSPMGLETNPQWAWGVIPNGPGDRSRWA